MDWDSGSIYCLEVAKSWVKDCVGNHEECIEGGTALPSRVLDISLSNEMITLTDGNSLLGRYASLSYCVSRLCSKVSYLCWGKTLTKIIVGGWPAIYNYSR
jgi:hypothetical protein